MIGRMFRGLGRGLRYVSVAIGALVLSGGVIAIADYTLTQGAGITMASVVISTKHYIALLVCDATVGETQCAAVDSTGNQAVKDAAVLAAVQAQIPACTSTPCNNIGLVGGSVNVTQTDCSIALTTGGTAQNIITAGATLHGFRIMNIDASAGSGEPVWMSFTTTAAASTIASYPLAAPTATTFAGAGSYSAEFASGTNGNVSVVAATTGHKISCTKW
jgi:hypothetical protein